MVGCSFRAVLSSVTVLLAAGLLILVLTMFMGPGYFPFKQLDGLFDLTSALAVALILLMVLPGRAAQTERPTSRAFIWAALAGNVAIMVAWGALFYLAGRS